MNNTLCFDIGATYIKYGVVSSEGNMLFKHIEKTPNNYNGNNILDKVCELIKSILKKYNINKIGISTAGIVDAKLGSIIYASDNILKYTGTRISERIENEFGKKCFVENDVNAAATGEMWIGAAEELENFICLTIGTGIGTTIVLNRKIYRGQNQLASYGGQMIINQYSGDEKNTFEYHASTKGLIIKYKELIKKDEAWINGKYILSKVKEKDKNALKAYEKYMDCLVSGLLSLTYLLDPGAIIIGGGISEERELLLNSIRDIYYRKGLSVFVENTKIRLAELGNDAALYGMAYICKE